MGRSIISLHEQKYIPPWYLTIIGIMHEENTEGIGEALTMNLTPSDPGAKFCRLFHRT